MKFLFWGSKNVQEPDWHKDLSIRFGQVRDNVLSSVRSLDAKVSVLSEKVEESLRSCEHKLTNDGLPLSMGQLHHEKSEIEKDQSDRFDQIEGLVRSSATDLDARVSAMESKFDELATLRSRQYKLANEELSLSIGRLQHEKAQVEADRDEWQQAFTAKDTELAKVTNDLAAANGLLAVKEQELGDRIRLLEGELQTAKEELESKESVHREEMSRLSQECDLKFAELTKNQEEALMQQKEHEALELEAVRKSVDVFVPPQVCELFDYRVGEPIEDTARCQAIYSYLSFAVGNLRPNVFAKRFREFDVALYEAMCESPDELEDCRARVQKHVNEVIGKKSGGFLVCWPRKGERYNPDWYTSDSETGQRVEKAIYAMVFKESSDGTIQCLNKGKVETT